ncbi:MAG: hypothetical protein AB8B50_01090 [Pirellulaceae bacterium]
MSATIPSNVTSKAQGAKRLKAQKVDYVASILMATLVVIGMLVLLLFIVWLTQTFTWKAQTITVLPENAAGRGDHAAGFERDIEPPGAEEVEELTEPTLEETLEAVTEAATSVAASLDAINSDSSSTTSGNGRGDSRPPGPLGEGDDVVPRHERWELKFQSKGLQPYATQLEFYKIELGCVGNGVATVDYAFQLGTAPQKRSGSSAEENKRGRLFFMWREENKLKQFDRQLLQRAGVPTQSRQILKFLPKNLEDSLYITEMTFAASKGHESVTEIAKTVFESRAKSSGGYEFVVIDQRYRTPTSGD